MGKTNNVIFAADLFCGAGGTSSGLITAIAALNLELRLSAVNHWNIAIDTHSKNHKDAEHYCQTLDTLDPRKVVPNGRLHLLVASPECVHHSNARGGKPMNNQSRASAWLILDWLEKLFVDCVLIENVKEFRSWGALGVNGRPLKSQRGKLYQQFLENLRALGYKVEDRVLNAADYGDATTRERLFIIARRDKKPIVWPDPTHAKRPYTTISKQTLQPWRTAREIIDWDLEGESIFNRKRPLAENTLKRIFAGLKKFCGLDFILPNEGYYRGNTPKSVDSPLTTITSRGVGALVQPFLVGAGGAQGQQHPRSVGKPLPTLTGTPTFALAQPYVVVLRNNVNHSSVDEPLRTLTTLGSIMGLAEPYFVQFNKTNDAQSANEPLRTLTTKDRFGLAQPYLIKMDNTLNEHSQMAKDVDKPLPTITTKAMFGLINPYLIEVNHSAQDGTSRCRDIEKPLPTLTTKGSLALLQPYLVKYFLGSDAESVEQPLSTITANYEHLGLAQPELEGNGGSVLLITEDGQIIGEIIGRLDIKFRMLQPHELAAAMSFPKNYSFSGNRAEQVKQIGNAVPCRLAEALCRSLLESKTSNSIKKKAA